MRTRDIRCFLFTDEGEPKLLKDSDPKRVPRARRRITTSVFTIGNLQLLSLRHHRVVYT